MPVYIALIRGINVGGKTMPMAALKDMFARLGYPEARTYIQSGNVVFTAPGKDAAKIAAGLEKAIPETFGYEAAVLVRSLDAWRALLAANPYAKAKPKGKERVYVTFLESAPAKAAAARLSAVQDPLDELKLKGTEIFLMIRGGYGVSNLSNAFVEKTLKLRATTRNLETSLKLLEMAEALEGPA